MSSSFERVRESVTVRKAVISANRCELAESFYQWASEQCSGALTSPSHVSINQTKIRLLDRYFEFRSIASKSHRYTMAPSSTHICLFHVLEDFYTRLRTEELKLSPPQLYLPPPPVPMLPPPPPVEEEYDDGTLLGELLDEE